MAARGWGKEAEFIPQSHTFFLTYTPVVRWQAPSLSNATRRKGLKGKTRWRILRGEAILEENRSFFFGLFISQIRFQVLVTMVTRIHVVDTLEQTQSLPPRCGHPALSLFAASLRARQGHGAVSYYKRSSPSLLQETQTWRSCAPHPRRSSSTTALITASARPFISCARRKTAENLDVPMFVRKQQPRRQKRRCAFNTSFRAKRAF